MKQRVAPRPKITTDAPSGEVVNEILLRLSKGQEIPPGLLTRLVSDRQRQPLEPTR
jgi:hypothetical protein